MCAPRVTRHTSNISSCQKKKNFFSFPVAVKNYIKIGRLVFLFKMFVLLFYVLFVLYCSMYCFVCKCVLPPGDNPMQLTNISYHTIHGEYYETPCI